MKDILTKLAYIVGIIIFAAISGISIYIVNFIRKRQRRKSNIITSYYRQNQELLDD